MSTPYWDAVKKIVDNSSERFNVPGHHNYPSDSFHKMFTEYDIPQIINTVDKGENNGLQQALTEASRVYGAGRTWFLTSGASQGNRMAGIMLGQMGGDKGIVVTQRNLHSSLFDGLIISGLDALFLHPSVDYESGIPHGVTVQQVEQALNEATVPVKALIIQTPSYFGAVADVEGFKKLTTKHNIPLIIDNAWGSHFGFHEKFPESMLKLGADVVISSTHKMGGSLTQSAMLFLNKNEWFPILEPLIERAYLITQSTSTSALLLASLDVSRSIMEQNYENFGKALQEAEEFKSLVRKTRVLTVANDNMVNFPDVKTIDPMKVAVNVSQLGVTGFELHERLLSEHGIFTEMATNTIVLFIFGIYPKGDISKFVDIIMSYQKDTPTDFAVNPIPQSSKVMPIREAFFAEHEIVPHKEAIGRISSDMLSAYPPGIPNILPGEVLQKDVIDFLRRVARSQGGYIRGGIDAAMDNFRVVK